MALAQMHSSWMAHQARLEAQKSTGSEGVEQPALVEPSVNRAPESGLAKRMLRTLLDTIGLGQGATKASITATTKEAQRTGAPLEP